MSADVSLRILFATARYLPSTGGTEIHTHEVATRIAARGGDVIVATTSLEPGFERESDDDGVTVRRVRAWPPNSDYFLAPALARVVRETRPDIVHCQGYHTFVAPIAMLAALSAEVPYVVTLHSGGHSSRLRHHLRPVQAWALRPLLRRADRVIAVSRFEANLFARRLGIPAEEFVVIPSGVELPPPTVELPSQDGPLVLSLGRVESYKGHQRVMSAMPALLRARPDLRLRIVGTGDYQHQLHELAKGLGVTESVEIAPVDSAGRGEMANLLSRASVVASLSSYESQGLAMQEALALGRPLLVSRDSALGELERFANVRGVGRRSSGEEIAAAILELLDVPPAEPPAHPTWDGCVAALLEVYEETLAVRR